jgi:hypothetical protein
VLIDTQPGGVFFAGISLGFKFRFFIAMAFAAASSELLLCAKEAFNVRSQLHPCDEVDQEITVVPKEKLGPYTVAALTAAEGRPRTQSPFIVSLFPPADLHVATYQFQLARTLVCPQHGRTYRD